MVKRSAGSSKLTLEQRLARELPVIDSMGRLIFDPIFAQTSHTTSKTAILFACAFRRRATS